MNQHPVKRLLEMLEFRRPAFSVYDEAFIDKFIKPYEPVQDSYGNLYVTVGDKPNILWSSHTDTVHTTSGLQRLQINKKNEVRVVPHKDSNCLGADCTTGVWLMLEMLDAGVEGLYVFHRNEEHGGLGSKWIAEKNPDALKGIEVAIAFDRKGQTDIITEMGWDVVCSDEFADSLAKILGGGYKKSNNGMFTDTKSYRGLVPECTNISVGYEGAHSDRESQDLNHARWLRDKMIKFDSSSLVIKRTPSLTDRRQYHGYHGSGAYWSGGYQGHRRYKEPDTLFELIRECPMSTSQILEAWGVTFEMWQDLIQTVQRANAHGGGKVDPKLLMLQPPVDKKKKAN